jgi:hypothetical protein
MGGFHVGYSARFRFQRETREIEAKLILFGSQKGRFFACFASKQNNKNLRQNEYEMKRNEVKQANQIKI